MIEKMTKRLFVLPLLLILPFLAPAQTRKVDQRRMKSKRISLVAIIVLMIQLTVFSQIHEKPNIIVIMADDLGAEGLACYGSTIYTTPNLDQMAEEGLQFNNAYTTPLCTPTRVMLMSGTYPHRNGFKALIGQGPGVRMPENIPTFGHYLRNAGYKTAIAGKWQLGKFDEHPDQPVEHGFNEYCMWTWFHHGIKGSRYYSPHIYSYSNFYEGKDDEFGPDFYSNFVLDFIDRNKDDPFFIYYPMALVHSPFITPPSLNEIASKNFTDDLTEPTKAFGQMITYMDDIVGKILTRLKAHGIDDNTLVVFTGDNGTHRNISSKLPGLEIQGGKGTMTEAGCRVPLIVRWPGTIAPNESEDFFCLVDVLPTLASITGIELTAEVDGMDLSHYFFQKEGQDREYIFMSFKNYFFVRDKRFRLDEEGNLYDIPVRSDNERYSEKIIKNSEYQPERARLQSLLDEFMLQSALYNGQESE
jgi:arylsulfatase A